MEITSFFFVDRVVDHLKRTPLFQDCDNYFLHCAAKLSTIRTLPPSAVILSANSKSTSVHIIMRGYCTMWSNMCGDDKRKTEKILQKGDAFPVVEVLHDIWSFISVYCLTSVEMISIPALELVSLFKINPQHQSPLKKALKAHMHLFDSILLRKGGRLPPLIPLEKSLGQGDMFTYELYDEAAAISKKSKAYINPFKELGRLII